MSTYLQGTNFNKAIDRSFLRTRSRELQDVVDAIARYVKEPNATSIRLVSKLLQHWKLTNPKEFKDRGSLIEADLRQELENAYHACHLTYERSVWGVEGRVRVLEGAVDASFQALMTQLSGGQTSMANGLQAASNAVGRMLGASETARRLFSLVNSNSLGETVVIVPMTNSGGGFVHKEKVREIQQTLGQEPDCRVNYIAWEPNTPFQVSQTDRQPAYKMARLNGAAVANKFNTHPPQKESIHLKVGAQICDDYPPEVVLLHEIGHAFQYIYGRAQYLHYYANAPVALDAMNITYIERPMLKELGTWEGKLYRMRYKYGNQPFAPAVLQQAPGWGYGRIQSATELNRLRQTLTTNAIYDPSDPNARRELTAASDYYVAPAAAPAPQS